MIKDDDMTVFNELSNRSVIAVGLAIVTIMLSGCGIKGSLDTPPPIWGEERAETEQRPEDSILNESPLDDEQDDIFADPLEEDTPG